MAFAGDVGDRIRHRYPLLRPPACLRSLHPPSFRHVPPPMPSCHLGFGLVPSGTTVPTARGRLAAPWYAAVALVRARHREPVMRQARVARLQPLDLKSRRLLPVDSNWHLLKL